jgi:molybdopterin-binding protein
MPLRVEMLIIIHLARQTIIIQEIGLEIGIGREIASILTRETTRLKGEVSTISLGIVTMVVVAQI